MAKKTKKKNEQWKKYMGIIAAIIIVISFIIQKNTYIRPILIILAVLILSVTNIINKTQKIIRGIGTFVLSIILLIIVDSIIVFIFKTIPVFAYNITTYGNIRVYNSIGIRVWQCDKNNYKDLVVDPFYKQGYMCDVADTDALSINSFLNSIVENYDTYNNNYVKIEGKISKKNSRRLIEMQSYEDNSITINGYVSFANNITLRVLFNSEEEILDNYDIYDDITVVGIIKNMEKNGDNYVIYMSDSRVIGDVNLDRYTLTVTPAKECKDDKLLFKSDNISVYTHCIEDIVIDYGQKKYELATVLSSGKLSVSELYNYSLNEEKNDTEDTLYYNGSYNVLVCNSETSNDIIIGDENMGFDDVMCHRKEI